MWHLDTNIVISYLNGHRQVANQLKSRLPIVLIKFWSLLMNISIFVPDDVIQKMEARWEDVSRRALEALAIEAYRAGVITEAEVQRMLNLSSRWETDKFLKQAQTYINYTEADLQNDIDTIHLLTQK